MAICAAVYLPGFFALPTVDRDEARFAQASRQMLEAATLPTERQDLRVDASGRPLGAHSGGWAVPMVQSRARLNKPPLIYWLQAAAAGAFTGGDALRDAIWMYRVPSLLAALATVLITWRWGRSLYDPRTAWIGAALLAICPIMVWEARQARADMVLVAFTTAAGWLLWELWKGMRPTLLVALALWIAVGFGVLVKGPVTPMVVLLCTLAMCAVSRRWAFARRIAPWLGIVVVAAMVAPWLALVAQRIGWDEYLALVRNEVVTRSLVAAEGHEGPAGYHTLLSFAVVWPASLLALAGVFRAVIAGLPGDVPASGGRIARVRSWLNTARLGSHPDAFLLCWVAPSWYVFELVTTKLPHYTMPLLPALAILSAKAATSLMAPDAAGPRLRALLAGRAFAWFARVWCFAGAAFALLAGAAVIGAVLGALASSAFTARGLATGAAMGGAIGLAWYMVRVGFACIREHRFADLLRLGGTVMLLSGVVLMAALPRVPQAFVSRRLTIAVASLDPTGARPVAFVKFHEDSSIFDSRGRFEWVEEYRLKFWLREHPGAIVVLPPGREAGWPPFARRAAVSGYNYSKGKAGTWTVGEMIRPIPLPSEILP